MNAELSDRPLFILVIGLVTLASLFVRALASRVSSPAIVSDELYAGLVLVCLATCLFTPPILQWQLARLPKSSGK